MLLSLLLTICPFMAPTNGTVVDLLGRSDRSRTMLSIIDVSTIIARVSQSDMTCRQRDGCLTI